MSINSEDESHDSLYTNKVTIGSKDNDADYIMDDFGQTQPVEELGHTSDHELSATPRQHNLLKEVTDDAMDIVPAPRLSSPFSHPSPSPDPVMGVELASRSSNPFDFLPPRSSPSTDPEIGFLRRSSPERYLPERNIPQHDSPERDPSKIDSFKNARKKLAQQRTVDVGSS